MIHRPPAAILAALLLGPALAPGLHADDALPPVSDRYADPAPEDVPDLQRHVLPLMGRLGCNGRACHGSFQGQGGFRLSLFGYDFEADYEALLAKDEGRVDPEAPDLSLILEKPTLTQPHKGGQILDYDSWQYNLLLRWIEAGAKPAAQAAAFERLEVTPSVIVFEGDGESARLKVLAHWSDGTVEDVTCLTRFQTNDESIATVDESGVVTAAGAGDTDVIAFYDNGVVGTQVIRPVSDRVGDRYPAIAARTEIDRLIGAKLAKLGVVPSEVCSDAEFLRRVSLDLTGSLPAPDEIAAFLADDAPEKRARKVDELLERETYAAWWTNKFCDITGASQGNLQGQASSAQMARDWYGWIYERVRDNVPYDELIAGIVLGTSREPGQGYEDYLADMAELYRKGSDASFAERHTMPYFWARRNIRQPEEKALAFSYAFLGVRLECAQCHKHPFDQWTQDDFNQFTAFFQPIVYGNDPAERDRVREMEKELGLAGKPGGVKRREFEKLLAKGTPVPLPEVYIQESRMAAVRKGSSSKSKGGRVVTPKVLGGGEVSLAKVEDPRKPLMDWLRSDANPYFAQAIVNRVWANHFGKGIIDPPDDMNLANPPSNPALLGYLTDAFVAHGYDLKWLHREILASDAYQRSWRPNETNRLDERNFSRALVRRLPAEVMLDAIAQATAAPDDLARFAVEARERSFGPVGGTKIGRTLAYADRVFGRSDRQVNCDCSRSDEPNLLQLIYLQNDQDVHNHINDREGWVAHVVATATDDGRTGEAARLDRQIDRAERELQALRKRGPKAGDEAKQMAARLTGLRKQKAAALKAAERRADAEPRPVGELIDAAFLRTLSRYPDASERTASLAYFEGSEDPGDGLRGLLWALLNTKEFMTNH